MPTAQRRNDAMAQLNQADLLRVQDKNFAAEWYDTGGSVYIAAITVPFTTERLNPAPEVYAIASGILTIAEAGVYELSFLVASSKTGATEGSIYAWLQEDPDTAIFADVPASTVYGTSFGAPTSIYNSVILRAGIDYRYRVRTATYGVPYTTIANGSKFSVVRLWKNG